MEKYRAIYTLKFEHEYHYQGLCRAIEVKVNPSSFPLMRQRGLLFKQTGLNEWSLVSDSPDGGLDSQNDVLLLDLNLSDPAFISYTSWGKFQTANAYCLNLPTLLEEAVEAIQETKNKRSIRSGFCTAEFRLNDKSTATLLNGNTLTNALKFHSKHVYWEYLLIPRNRIMPDKKKLVLKDLSGQVEFSSFSEVEIFGYTALRTLSTSLIPMHERYESNLTLQEITAGNLQTVKTLMKHIPHPRPGVFHSTNAELLRNICYF